MTTQLELDYAWVDEIPPGPTRDKLRSGRRVVSWNPYTIEHPDGTREVRPFPGTEDDEE